MKQLSLKLHHFRRIAILFLLLVALQAFTTCGGNKKDKKSPQEEWYSKVNIPTPKHFHQVVANKKLDEVKQIFILLDASPFKEKDEKELLDSVVGGTTALAKAIEGGDEPTVEFLTKLKNIHINKTGRIDATGEAIPSLFLALKLTKPRIAEILLTNDTNKALAVAYKDPASGNTSLHLAARQGYVNVVKALLDPKYHIDVNAQDKDNQAALHAAASHDRIDIVKLLLASGANVNQQDRDWDTALHLASRRNLAAVVEALLDPKYNIDVNQQNKKGDAALHVAAYNNFLLVVKLLLNAENIKINLKGEGEGTPLHQAASQGCTEIVKLLLPLSNDVNAKDHSGNTPLHLAAWGGCVEVVKLLLPLSNDVNTKGESDNTPLHLAAREGHTEVVKLLLGVKDIDVNAQNSYDHNTPLHLATVADNVKVVELLLSHPKIRAQQKNAYAKTPLNIAKSKSYKDCVKAIEDYMNS